jgi:hypothetical protein
LHEIYNRSLVEYRRAYRVRSTKHPAPDLATDGDWLEAPFWMWTAADPRRKRVFVRRDQKRLVLTDRAGTQIELPGTPEGDNAVAAQVLAELPAREIKLRTRALITTLWARLALSDAFLHGIGGAKYDQLTDRIFERFFGVAAPAYLTVTATLRLPIARLSPSPAPTTSSPDSSSLEDLDQLLRDLDFHPECWLDRHPREVPPQEQATAEEIRQTKARWIATPQTSDNARGRCREIRAANESLARWTQRLRSELLARREAVRRQERAAAIFSSREFAFCLFPPETLRNFLLEFLAISSYSKTT